jgi:hypothetical protein
LALDFLRIGDHYLWPVSSIFFFELETPKVGSLDSFSGVKGLDLVGSLIISDFILDLVMLQEFTSKDLLRKRTSFSQSFI